MTLEELLVICGLFAIAISIIYYAENQPELSPEISVTPNITVSPAEIKPIEKQAIIVTIPTTQTHTEDPLDVGNWVVKADSGVLEKLIWEKVNTERTERKLDVLRYSELMSDISRQHAQDMASRNYVSHISPEGLGPGDRADCNGKSFTKFRGKAPIENIIMLNTWQGVNQTVIDAVYGWMQSKDHKRAMLGDFNHSGIGVAIDNNGQAYVVQIFC